MLLVYFFLFSLKVNAQTATDYYPFDVGNYWVYKDTSLGDKVKAYKIAKNEIECIEELNSRMAYRFKFTVMDENNNPVSSYSWYQIEAGSIISIAIGAKPDLILVEWEPPLKWLAHNSGSVGATWTNRMEMQHSEYPDSTIIQWRHYLVVSNSETVTVTAGTFKNCIKIQGTVESSTEESYPVTYRYYAPNAGEVLRVTENPDGTVSRKELIDYSVGMK